MESISGAGRVDNKATLVVMAAGIGSRYGGGIKQLAQVGPSGEIIMDYSIYDALEAGFDKIVFVIRRDIEDDFRAVIGDRVEKQVPVSYVFQETGDIPEPFAKTMGGRTKPWGTGQAILCCADKVNAPFVVINADDYYGKEAFVKAFEYLTSDQASDRDRTLRGCMISFVLDRTLSENGAVTRGVCKVDEKHRLVDIRETKGIVLKNGRPGYEDESGWHDLQPDSPVSMNMWGLPVHMFPALQTGFEKFLSQLSPDDNSSEYLLPVIIRELLAAGEMEIDVLTSGDRWFGVTYQEDKAAVASEISKLVARGLYPHMGHIDRDEKQ